MSATITDFLLARIAEDEADANYLLGREDDEANAYGKHFLAECAAKRAAVQYLAGLSFDKGRDVETAAQYRSVLWIAQGMARVYADHPDYRQEWVA